MRAFGGKSIARSSVRQVDTQVYVYYRDGTEAEVNSDIIHSATIDMGTSRGFQVGTTYCAKLTMILADVIPVPAGTKIDYISVNVRFKTATSSWTDWLGIGCFYIDSLKQSKNLYTLIAYDKMMTLEKSFYIQTPAGQPWLSYLDELVIKKSIELASFTFPVPSTVKITGGLQKGTDENGNAINWTYREFLNQLALMNGINFFFNSEGKLDITRYDTVSDTVSADEGIEGVFSEASFTIKDVKFSVPGQSYNTNTENTDGVIEFVNNLVFSPKVSVYNAVYNHLVGIAYEDATITYHGHGWLEIGDIFTVYDNQGTQRTLLVTGIKYKLASESFTETVYSSALSQSESNYNSGDMQGQTVSGSVVSYSSKNKAAILKDISFEENSDAFAATFQSSNGDIYVNNFEFNRDGSGNIVSLTNITTEEVLTLSGIPEGASLLTAEDIGVYVQALIDNDHKLPYSRISGTPTKLSEFTDDLGSSPAHTHSQYLTEHQDISGKVDKTTKVNGKALSSDINLSASDVGALPDSTQLLQLGEVTGTAYDGGKGKSVRDDLNTHIADNVRHITADERTAWNALPSDISAINSRIDNLIIEQGGDSPTEVMDARTGYDGTIYNTLKTRIDSEVGELSESINEIVNYGNNKGTISIDLTTKNVVKGVFAADGKYTPNNSYIVTKKVFNISEFELIDISVDAGYSFNVAFYDTSDESSFISILDSSWVTVNRRYIPLGKYIRIQLRNNSGVANIEDINHVRVTGYNDKSCKALIFSLFEEAVNYGDYYIETYKDFTQGALINGVLTPNISYIATKNFVPVKDIRTLHLNVANGYRAWIICYDNNKNFMFASQRMDGDSRFDVDVSHVDFVKIQVGALAGNTRSGEGINALITATKKDNSTVYQNIGVQNIFVQGAIVNGAISSAVSRIATQEFIDVVDFGLVGITVKNDYYFALVLYDSASDSSAKYSTPWLYSNNQEIVFDVSKYSYMRMTIRNSSNTVITPDNGKVVTKVRGVLKSDAFQYGIVEEIATKKVYEGDRVSINPTLNFYNILQPSGFSTEYPFTSYFQQGAAIHNGYMFLFRHHGVCSIFNINSMQLVNEFEIASITSDLPHCDNASFSRIYPNGNNDFPYCYVSRTSYPSETPSIPFNDRNACYVFNITTNGATLVQTIKFDNTGTMPFAYGSADWVVDAERNRLIAYHQGASHGDSDAPWIFKEFALPPIGSSVVQLTESDILDEWRFDNVVWGHNFGICQGLDVTGRYIFAPCSNPNINKEALVVLDKYNHKIVSCSEWDKDITDELQSATTYKGALYLVSEDARIDKIVFD